eukprot:scpid69257/ scgid32191/ 
MATATEQPSCALPMTQAAGDSLRQESAESPIRLASSGSNATNPGTGDEKSAMPSSSSTAAGGVGGLSDQDRQGLEQLREILPVPQSEMQANVDVLLLTIDYIHQLELMLKKN